MSQTFTYKIWTSIVHFLGSYYSIHIHYPSVARQVVANQKDHNKKKCSSESNWNNVHVAFEHNIFHLFQWHYPIKN